MSRQLDHQNTKGAITYFFQNRVLTTGGIIPYSYESVSMDFLNLFAESDKVSDLTAVISSVYRYKTVDENEIRRLIRCTGQLPSIEIEKFLRVYKNTMEDLIELFSIDERLKAHIGI